MMTAGVHPTSSRVWQLPHDITLLTSHRNNDCCYLLFEQPFSGHLHATPCASSYLWFPSHYILALTKSTHCHFSSRLKGTNASSSSSSYLHSWCSPHDSRLVTKWPVWNSHHECLKLSYSSFWTLKFFIAEMEYCSPQQNGRAALLALLLIAVRDVENIFIYNIFLISKFVWWNIIGLVLGVELHWCLTIQM